MRFMGTNQVVARLLKFNNEVVYEHLLTPEVPFALDYLEVVFSLCEVMCRVYAKFVEEVRSGTYCTYRALRSRLLGRSFFLALSDPKACPSSGARCVSCNRAAIQGGQEGAIFVGGVFSGVLPRRCCAPRPTFVKRCGRTAKPMCYFCCSTC